jgi:hypothetical protein
MLVGCEARWWRSLVDRFGLGSSTVSMVFPFLKVLLGMGRFEVLGACWDKARGHISCGSLSFRRFAIVVISFFFFLGMLLLLLP